MTELAIGVVCLLLACTGYGVWSGLGWPVVAVGALLGAGAWGLYAVGAAVKWALFAFVDRLMPPIIQTHSVK